MKKILTFIFLSAVSICSFAQEIKQTTLVWEKTGDMNVSRMDHSLVPAGDGKFMAVGGHTSGFSTESSAEIYEDGQWRLIEYPSVAHDTGSSIVLPDGRSLIFGGHKGSWGTNGGNDVVDVFNPATESFTSAPTMLSGRAMCKGLCIANEVFIFGDYWASYWGQTPPAIDRWRINDDGTFSPLNNVAGIPHHSQRYPWAGLRSDNKGFVIIDSYSSSNVNFVDVVSINGEDATLTTREMDIFSQLQPFYATMRPDQYDLGDGRFIMTCLEDNNPVLVLFNVNNLTAENILDIPTDFDGIHYRYYLPIVNKQRKEAYLIACEASDDEYSYAIITVGCSGDSFTVKEVSIAGGFSVGNRMAGYALMTDGRILMTGGSTLSNFDAHADCFIFTPNSEIAAGIKGVENDGAEPEAFYDLAGRRISNLSKGLNIIKSTDGNVNKVYIK